MNFSQAFKISLKSILSNKARSFLTMLGIIIGVAAVIVLVSLVQGMQAQVAAEFEKMGTNKVQVYDHNWPAKNITAQLDDFCVNHRDLVVGMTPVVNDWLNIKYKGKILECQIALSTEQYSVCNAYELVNGRDLSYLDVTRYNQVCVIGAAVANKLFNFEDPIGKAVSINGEEYTVIGVYEAKDDPNAEWSYYDSLVVLPYTLASRMQKRETSINQFVLKAADSESTAVLIEELNQFLPGLLGADNFWVYSANEYIDQSKDSLAIIGLVLGGIAGISLVVGGIGIMNIMLVTVTERTREIGIRKAIGAPRSAIITQFLIEASVLSSIGGLIGILLGSLLTLVMGKLFMQVILLPTISVILLAALVSIAFGVGFGLYPAAKASKLQPVEALRTE